MFGLREEKPIRVMLQEAAAATSVESAIQTSEEAVSAAATTEIYTSA